MATLKEFEEALKAAGNTAALEILEGLRARDRANRTIRPARRLTGRKMTPELAAEILHLHATTQMTQQEIAFQLGVNQGRVNEVIKRRKWLDGDPNAPEAAARDKAVERAKAGVGFGPRRPAAPAKPAEVKPAEMEAEAKAKVTAPDRAKPKAEAPKVEPPKAEAPKVEAPKVEAKAKPRRSKAAPPGGPTQLPFEGL